MIHNQPSWIFNLVSFFKAALGSEYGPLQDLTLDWWDDDLKRNFTFERFWIQGIECVIILDGLEFSLGIESGFDSEGFPLWHKKSQNSSHWSRMFFWKEKILTYPEPGFELMTSWPDRALLKRDIIVYENSNQFIGGDGWYFRLVSCLQRSLWNENQFVNYVNLF